MKILVYNSKHQYALSRRQIQRVQDALPKEYFAPILQFHISGWAPGQEKFEYNYRTKIAYLNCPVVSKTDKDVEEAVRAILVGLARIRAKDRFGHFIPRKEKVEYEPFVEEWLPKCILAITRNH